MFAGYVVGIIVVMLLAISVIQKMTAERKQGLREYFREQAISVAKAGFEEGTSYFRRQPGGVDLADTPWCPSNTNPIPNTYTAWPLWPDAAFKPYMTSGTWDTDYYAQTITYTGYNNLTTPAMTCAAAIIRTYPLMFNNSSATAQVASGGHLWGRFVIKRQNARNWSPGNNTFAAFSDPEACHDLSAIRASSALGSGTVWSVFSHGYVFTYPTDLTIPAAFEGQSILNSPLHTFNGQSLLMAEASVYGEIQRMNFSLPAAATYLSRADGLYINNYGYVDGTGGSIAAFPSGSGIYSPLNGGASVPAAATTSSAPAPAPALGTVFPGMNAASLQAKASQMGKYGTMTSIFPTQNDTNFASEVGTSTFLYCSDTGGVTFLDSSTDPSKNELTGVGLAYFASNLTVSAGSLSSWAGIVYVNGNVLIQGPGDISGILVATGSINLTGSNGRKATVEYNSDAIAQAEQLLESFTVLENSVVVTSQ